MTYVDGTPVRLGDVVKVPVRQGKASARVVMLGDTYEHLDIDESFLAWVKRDRVLDRSNIVVQWLDENPFAHDDPRYAPVGNYMFTPVDACVEREV